MTNPEAPQTQNPEIPQIQNPEAPKAPEDKIISVEEAKQMVEDFLKAPETPKALSNLQNIEEQYKAGSLPVPYDSLYRNAKEKVVAKLKNDNNFKEALKQVWANIDGLSLLEIWKEDAKNIADGIVENPETKKQVEDVKEILFKKNYAKLRLDQQTALDSGVKVFKDSIILAKVELWIA